MKNFIKILLLSSILTFNFSCSKNGLKVNNQTNISQPENTEKRELVKEEDRKVEKLSKERNEYLISPDNLPDDKKLHINLKAGWEKVKDAQNSLEYRILFRDNTGGDETKQKNLLILSNNSDTISDEELLYLIERLAIEYFSIDKITDFRKGKINNIEYFAGGGLNSSQNALIGLMFFRNYQQVYIVFCEDKNDLKDCGEIISTIH